MLQPQSNAPRDSLTNLSRDLYYANAWHPARSGRRVEIKNPATSESLGEVAWAQSEDVNAAVKAAYEGFKLWRRTKPLEVGHQ